MTATLSEQIVKMETYFRAANYLSACQIYLLDNPLLKEPLQPEHIKPRLLGHWGTTPGLNFIYLHLNRAIVKHNLNILNITGPGHGAPAIVANAYMEGTWSELYPHITQDEAGLKALFKQFSFPGGIPSHCAPEVPGSINEGGELGYSLTHAYGAVLDNPDLIAACVIGDGEAETGALAASWHSNKFLHPIHDGTVLPILHLNGYKIANPTILARIPQEELQSLLIGYGYRPYFVDGSHELMQNTLDQIVVEIRALKKSGKRPFWPMIVLSTLKGWTGPKEWDGQRIEGTFRAHQVPLTEVKTNPLQLKLLESWLKSYRPEELFDENGTLKAEIRDFAPKGNQRMSANPHANGGSLLKDLILPDFRRYEIEPGVTLSSAKVLGSYLRDVMKSNMKNFRVMGPDETASNRLQDLFEVTDRDFMAKIIPLDDHLSPDGRVMEVLSEHLCQGWLEGYLLTGRHGFFNCYEAFVHIVDSMFNQHAKWLESIKKIGWRKPIASLNYFLSSHVWRQDHNGFSHQDPGFIDVVMNKTADVIRIYLPPDANTLLSVADHCLRSRNYVNVIIAGKQPEIQYYTMEQAIAHCTKGIGLMDFACNDEGNPDAVMVCCGDVPTLETLAAVDLLRNLIPDIKLRVLNVIDLMVLQKDHPHGISEEEFLLYFTKDKPIIFAFHGYPLSIHRLTYKRANHDHIHVRGFQEKGTTTTPFDMCVINDMDRYHLAMDTVERIPRLADQKGRVYKLLDAKLKEHHDYIRKVGDDMPEVKNWKWPT